MKTNGFLTFWQHLPESIEPVIFQVGGFRLQYYGLMYIVAFLITYGLVIYRINHEKNRFQITGDQVKDLTVSMILGLVIGARLGYVIFYNLSYYTRNPLEIFLPFQFSNGITFTGISGMSYHGGLAGLVVATVLFVRKHRLALWQIADLYSPVAPLGYTFGRLGNFINGELYGRITASPIGMYFPMAPGSERRHPSQLYEAFFEGIFLFVVLWLLRKKRFPQGAMLAFYLAGYGTVRFFIEYFREPDAHLGFVFLSFTMGQVLCGLMIICAVLLYGYLRLHPFEPNQDQRL
ncbi:MAG: prolipoprotein diacylglyceryl transferase [Deltaproteobacteria bacterium]|nr:prolipoprotein diacylglyceryl transferase [Deltaproteobacteria bacterium]